MHSSTSSSSHRAPGGPWLPVWVAALTLAALMLAGLEFGWRSRGFKPEVPDNPQGWILCREAATRYGADAVALVGSSRFQVDIDPEILSRGVGGRPVQQLSINGSSPFPILKNLAEDEDFLGTVLVEFTPARFFTQFPQGWAKAESFLVSWKSRSWDLPMEMWFRSLVQQRLALIRSHLSISSVINSVLREGELPRPGYITVLPNRSMRGDYSQVDAVALDEKWAEGYRTRELLTSDEVEERMDFLAEQVRAIEGRGGRVVFFRINSGGLTRALEAERFPRVSHYELYRSTVGGEWIHFEDDSILREIPSGDGSHVDQTNVPELSARLAELL